jgi:hypothetical protein
MNTSTIPKVDHSGNVTAWPSWAAEQAIAAGLLPRSVVVAAWANDLPANIGRDETLDYLRSFLSDGFSYAQIFWPDDDYASVTVITPSLPFDDGRF